MSAVYRYQLYCWILELFEAMPNVFSCFLMFYTCFVAMPNVSQQLQFSSVLRLLRGNAKRFSAVFQCFTLASWQYQTFFCCFLVFYTCFMAMPNVFQLFSIVLCLLRGNAKRLKSILYFLHLFRGNAEHFLLFTTALHLFRGNAKRFSTVF